MPKANSQSKEKRAFDLLLHLRTLVLFFSKDNGRTKYKRIGIIKPIKGKIWDNRYMAVEEEAVNALLKYTTFEVVSGKGFYPGMLVREIR